MNGTIKLTYAQLLEANSMLRQLNSKIKFLENPTSSKLNYAASKTTKEIDKHIDSYNEALGDIKIKHALEKDGKILTTAKGDFEYSKETLEAMNKEVRDLMKKEIEVTVQHKVSLEIIKTDYSFLLESSLNGILFDAELVDFDSLP